ncbi:SRPBCC family protein [Streptomyces hoynatensis]|uniref:SRPBCC family protein n=1 Tax=Streptomyces hoynatensis TaxID=1141874 RepID=A0A3A9YXR9_9ACTN|nr:SRPBCC family protein [Streptomyces hoynatensis]RKN40912.1 SRPBCC family protein [Streptomyces hoynatensis]
MANEERGGGATQELGESFERLRHEVVDFLNAQARRLAENAGDRVSRLTEKISGDTGGALPKAGARLLGGESPGKAVAKEGAKSLKEGTVGKAKGLVGKGGGGNGGGDGGGKSGDVKVTGIIESIDVGAPLRDCYNHWTQYRDFGEFMKGVQSVEPSGDEDQPETTWKLKIGPSNRDWKATVLRQIPDERIEWTSEGSKGDTRGVVTFHELAPRLTRIVAVVEYHPEGFFEKTANLWRAQGRRLRLDLKAFQRYVTLVADEVPEGWRGEIRDGRIVRSHEDALAAERGEGAEGSEGEAAEEEEQAGRRPGRGAPEAGGGRGRAEDDEEAEDEDEDDEDEDEEEEDEEDDEDEDGEEAERR